MTVSDGKLRPAASGEDPPAAAGEIASWQLTRLPGLGREGLAELLANGGPSRSAGAALVITCTCGHLFLGEPPKR